MCVKTHLKTDGKRRTEAADSIIRTAIVEQQPELRDGLVTLINSAPGFLCSGSYVTTGDALAKLDDAFPDVVLCDLAHMGEIGGIRALRDKYPNLLIIVLSIYDDDELITDALCAGADGYLLKRTLPARLLENIREAFHGGAPISPEVAARIIRLFRDFHLSQRADFELTPHETRLLKLLVEGHNYTTAAKVLSVSYNTVKFHMRRIYQKLEVNSKSAAVAKVMRHRLFK
jgi:DNA-binding NarL/FixJ family response regulator